jgi:hypothetical protein
MKVFTPKNKRVIYIMVATKQTTTPSSKSPRRTHVPLIIESHPKDYNGYPFLTLIQYKNIPMLVIIDNIDDDSIKAFVLDLCDPEDINKGLILQIATDWYENDRENFPISIAFSRLGIVAHTSRIYRVLNTEMVSRVIGPAFRFPIYEVKSVRRRRKKQISTNVEIVEFIDE